MRGLLGAQSSLINLFPHCDTANGEYSPLIDRSEADFVTTPCNGLGKDIITCRHADRGRFIQEARGLVLDLKISPILAELPAYIPTLDYSGRKIAHLINEEFVGITLADIMSSAVSFRAGMIHENKKIIIRKNVLEAECFKDKKVILFLSGSDTLIEWVWYNRDDIAFFETISSMGFWAVTGFNFSVIEGECPFSHALNLKRSLLSAFLAEQSGLKVIPHIYCIHDFHVNRWKEWFVQNREVNLFTVNCQLQKGKHEIEQIVTVLRSIFEAVPYVKVVLQGFPLNYIHKFGHYLDRIHFSDKAAIKYAQSRRKFEINHGVEKLFSKFDFETYKQNVFQTNIEKREGFVKYMREFRKKDF